MIISDLAHGYVLPETLTTGLLGSLVAITAPCAVVTEGESVVIGMIGALLAIYGNLWETWMQHLARAFAPPHSSLHLLAGWQ